MEYASKFVERAVDVVLDLTIRHVGYIFYYKENVSELNSLVEKLNLERKRLEHRVDEAEDNLGITESNVAAWLQKVDKTRTETEEFQDDEGHMKTRFSSGLFHYLRNRHRLGRKAKKMAVDVKLLVDESKFGGVSYQQKPTSMHAALFNDGYVEFDSRARTIERIMEKLEDSTARMIGVHGPGGVGKSTLIKEIVKKAQVKKLFNVVVIAEITDNPNLRKIQEEIAYVLGLNLEGEGETVRADRLRRRLKKERENTLVVMDDLWDRIDLNKIGIPFDDDMDDDSSRLTIEDRKDPNFTMVKKGKSPGDYNGCKVLLTSRDRKVLSDKMDVKSVFCVRELDDKESLMLFKKVAGILDKMSTFKQEIVKKYCAGLPMAIVTVGRALRNKSESVWEATLEKLKKEELSGVQKSMEISVKMSYDHLESEELRSIFLLCAQMGHQQLIMDLVKYCFGLGILEGVYTLREARDRVYTSIQKLKDSSLMLDCSSNDHFNMHDMVQDAALSIAHKEKIVFALRNGKLDDWPDKDILERCTTISLRNCDIIDELPKVIHCPQLKFFQIDSNDPSLKIPEIFFEGMEKLRVLILTGFHLSCLPSSIKCLLNLRMLCLERCALGENLSIVGKLKKLRILSFSGSQIENLPAELGFLDKLQLFDISDCSIMKAVSPNFISSLTCLEELYIRKSLIKVVVDGEPNQSQISFLSQLKHLHQLRVVDLRIPSAAVLPRDLFFDRLNDYKIVIGDFKMLSVGDFRMPNKYKALRSLALLTDSTDIHSQKGIKLLFERVENLLLGELNGVQNAFYELNLNGFPDLKHLSIINNNGIEYIVNSMELLNPQNVFLNLESLCLYKLRKIKMLCCTPVTDASFAKLKTIKVKMCTQMKTLFSFYMVKFLASLETIDVSECDSLEEIVVKTGQANFNKVELNKLRSLTLQSLPSFTCFYTCVEMPSAEEQIAKRDHIEITVAEDDHSVMDPLSLFGELIEIPNLESLKLSSIKSHRIWRDRPLSNFCFQNLIKLTVNDCYNLKYLCSLSVASNFKKLKGLFISDCGMMEKIFITEGNSIDKVRIFPKLEEMHLTRLNRLKDIWQVEVGADSFSSLISVQIEECNKLDKIFPSHMTGWFGSLDSLKVINCLSVEVIFEIKDFQQMDASRMDTNLQLIVVEQLPNLKQVWDRDPQGILSFKNLRNIKVFTCNQLGYLLPASVAKDLKRLEGILLNICDRMEEIVAWDDGPQTRLVFPEVTFMKLYGLPKVKRFYKGGHIECPKLKQLAVDFCEKLDMFTAETTNEERQAVFLAEKVISNLEFMETGLKEALWLKSNKWKYRMDCMKELSLRLLESIELLYWFLDRMPNLERLNLLFSYTLEELVPSENIAPQERLGTVLQLKTLYLRSSVIKNLGFDRDPLLQRLEHLLLFDCHSLVTLAPSSLSLTHLTYLEVNSCRGLMNLMAISTAKSMAQLAKMKVIECSVQELVTNEGNEEDRVIEVVFIKLVFLELVRLENLTSFCSYKNCEFKFPSLEILIVRDCLKMETFTVGQTTAPKLQNVHTNEGEEEEKQYWEGDLNSTIQKVFKDKIFFRYTKKLNLYDHPELLEQVWHCSDLVHEYMFHNLTSLVVSQCDNLVHVIPSHLLPCFGNLEELNVTGCSAVKVIFNINDARETKALGTFRLKKLFLYKLPILEHVWDKDPEGNFCLQVLQEMSVIECDTLKYLFPASVAKDLTRLDLLRVTHCKELVEIFSENEIPAEGATKEFMFPSLTSLYITKLPALKYFYRGLHKLEWPVLKELYAYRCNLVILECQEDHPEGQALVPVEKIPSMKHLSFGIGDTEVTWNPKSCTLQFEKLQCFPEESDRVLYRFLGMLPIIRKLEFKHGLHEELFSAERPNADYTRFLLHLKEIELNKMFNLNSIGLEHSWLHPIPENLQTLEVRRCSRLINLVPHMVSFSSLTYLAVNRCSEMLYLFTSSTAKNLCRLKVMKIESCESMQEIVSTEKDESGEDKKLIFEDLHTLFLRDLSKLRCFYPGKFSLCFPSLEKVSLIQCIWMKTFSPVNMIDPTKLSSGVTFIKDKTPQWEGDLNATIRKRFEEEVSDYAPKGTVVRLFDEPVLQDVWHGLPVPHSCFGNLEELIVDGCQFLSEVLPSNLLPFLTKMEKLAVRNCGFVKTIFDVKCITEDRKMTTKRPALIPFAFSLKILALEQLPNLENVWNEDPHGILTIELLKQVYVDECKGLTSLFPASVAKDLVKLEDLHVKHCEELMLIVAENNADPKGTILELSFPCVISMTLLELPKLKYFYRSLHFDTLKLSTHQESHSEGEVIDIEKLTPNLHNLLLSEKELKIISRRNLLHKLKALYLVCFHVESDVLPYAFLQQVPNIQKLAVSCSSFTEIFCFQRPDVVYTELLSHLKVLTLDLLMELVSIGLEHSWVEPLIKNLETLEIARCFRLRNIAASTVCFSNLMHLFVSDCNGLVNLFTSSTAKSLARLKTMNIICCESIQEIVSHEGDASYEDQKIIFEELQALYLKDLHELKCFYSGNFTLCFPSLEHVFVINCHKMETFCPGTINADKLLGVKFHDNSDAVPLEIDVNSTIQKEFLAQADPNNSVKP